MIEKISEVEQAVIGCILLNYKRCMPIVQSLLKPADFFEPRHEKIYSLCLKMDRENKAIDLLTVSDEIIKNNTDIDRLYVNGLNDLMPTAAHVDTYCEQVKEASKTRQLTQTVYDSMQELKDGNGYKDVIDKITKSIGEIEADKIGSFVNARDIVMDVYENIKNGRSNGLLTGYEKLDRLLRGFDKNDLIILAADTGKGKSAMALNIIAGVIANDKTVLEYSIEMSNTQNVSRLVACMSETDSRKPDSDLMEHERTRRLDALGKISASSFIMVDASLTAAEIRATAKAKENELARVKQHIDFIVVDYAQIITPSKGAENRQQEVAETGQQFNALAKEIKCPVMLLSQVNGDYQKEKRRLRLGDLRESKALAHPATVVMLLNKDKEDLTDPFYTLEILKNRHGPLFYVQFEFIPQFTKFIEKAEDKPEVRNANFSWQKD